MLRDPRVGVAWPSQVPSVGNNTQCTMYLENDHLNQEFRQSIWFIEFITSTEIFKMAAERRNNPVVWTPSDQDRSTSSLARFRDLVNKKYDTRLKTYADIHAWSIGKTTAKIFWMELFSFLEMGASRAPSQAFDAVSRIGE